MIKLAVIGTSGRYDLDSKKLSHKHIIWMMDNIKIYIEEVLNTTCNNVILVSGGSAWADHVAICLYNENNFNGLELYLPTDFNLETKKYCNTHCGCILNDLHAKFTQKTNMNSLKQIANIHKNPNVKINILKGFFSRNTAIAKSCDHLVAFTFHTKNPTKGGTADTWKKFKSQNKLHLDLNYA
jgi:hypothetical protein